MKRLIKITGNISLIMFIILLSGVAVSMLFRKEDIAEKLGNVAYFSLLIAAFIKIYIYRNKENL